MTIEKPGASIRLLFIVGVEHIKPNCIFKRIKNYENISCYTYCEEILFFTVTLLTFKYLVLFLLAKNVWRLKITYGNVDKLVGFHLHLWIYTTRVYILINHVTVRIYPSQTPADRHGTQKILWFYDSPKEIINTTFFKKQFLNK